MKFHWAVVPLFLLAGCVSKSTYQDLQDKYNQEIAANQQTISVLQGKLNAVDAINKARLASLEAFRRDLRPLIERGILDVKVEDGNIIIGMASDVLFASGSAALTTDGKANVIEVAKVLASRTEVNFQVEGHTDNEAINTKEYPNNWYLGASRSITVVSTMIGSGMPADRVSAASYSDTRPVAPNDTPVNRAFNRRIEIVVVPDLTVLPGYDVLLRADQDSGRPRRGKRGN